MRNKKGEKGFMAIKVDLEKAYDKLEWEFVRDTLQDLGFQESFTEIIMNCFSSTRMKILWNGEPTESFTPTRGVKQGDPLSPYIFVLCMERLGHLILNLTNKKKWIPIQLARQGPKLSHLFFADDLLLFAEASMEQMEIIKDCLDKFCQASGQTMNLSKTRIHFSRNVNHNRVQQLSNFLGVRATTDLGKYLGMPLLHKRITNSTFDYLLTRTASKLGQWKGRLLNMPGRTVLIKSVLSSIPNYAMQTVLLPKRVLLQLDKTNRRFLWCSTEQRKKMHQIAWREILQTKENGGLGIRDAEKQNQALILKMCWELTTKPEALWVRVMRSKYRCGETGIPEVKKHQKQSQIWNSIVKMWCKFLEGLGKYVQNGRNTLAWFDKWSPLPRPLLLYAKPGSLNQQPTDRVSDWVTESGSWNINKIQQWFDKETLRRILIVNPPNVQNGEDRLVWRPAPSGTFTVKSAYNFLQEEVGENDSLWKRIWRLPVPEKIKYFIWQASHGKLMTNSLRAERGLTENNRCVNGCSEEETILHVLRDCLIATQCWQKLVKPQHMAKFRSLTLKDWLRWNIARPIGNINEQKWEWNIIFPQVAWTLWTERCKAAMTKHQYDSNSVLWKNIFRIREDENLLAHKWCVQAGEDQNIYRTAQIPSDCFRLDVDGSCENNDEAACGGVIRTSDGRWISGFTRYLGYYPSTIAELWGIYTGL